ncbi:Smyd3 [Symbiodinium natans]|uniref:Smyd3 protein n=1 Tax=Symbiodinium natans TaxID=878477 RepID=A0A812R9E4_9DINO|nr:Smyd3 [Symbiodinium natans]
MAIMGDSETPMCCEPAFKTKRLPGRGRSVIASRALAAGEVVLIEQPWALVLLPEEQHQRCDFDLSTDGKLLHCRATGLRFASKENQRAAKDLYYEAEVKAAAAAAGSGHADTFPLRGWPTTLRLAVRALQRGAAHGEQPWQQLESHWDELTEPRHRELEQHAARCLDMLAAGLGLLQNQANPGATEVQQFQAIANISDVAHFLAALDVNAMTVTDEEQRDLGLGLYLQGAVFNHDEEPNCIQSFVGRQLKVRTCKAVNAGDELCITYAELAEMSKTRHDFLSQHYHFRPHLQPQAEQRDAVLSAILVPPEWSPAERGVGWDAESGVQDLGSAATALVRKVSDLRSQARANGEDVQLLLSAWQEATSGQHFRLGEGHILRWTLARELMDAFVASERWQEALVFARAVSSTARHIFPVNWPVVSLSLARLAKLELYFGNFANASCCCEEALFAGGLQPSPSLLCWEDRPILAREIRQVLAQASAEAQAMGRGLAAKQALQQEALANTGAPKVDLDGMD